jgi:hypothetical protein
VSAIVSIMAAFSGFSAAVCRNNDVSVVVSIVFSQISVVLSHA